MRASLVICLKITETAGLVLRSIADLQYRSTQEIVNCGRVGLFDGEFRLLREWLSDWEKVTVTVM